MGNFAERIRLSYRKSGGSLASPLSEFNTVLNQVLALTEATTTKCGLLLLDSIERHRC